MIYYNSNTIKDWNFGDDNIIKVYRNNAVCYYKITGGGDTPTAQTPCFAVVDDITQYQETEFEDVFNKADNKWYKLNNLNQYEEYGVYGEGRNITYYEGKLTIDDDYEYQYSGGSWVNVGEVSGSTASYKYWMWRSTGDIVGRPSNFIQFSEFDLSVDGSDVSLTYISASPTGVTNETADNLFDNSTNTKYCADFSSYKTTNYVLFESQSAITPTSFAMTTANDSASTSRYPKNWVLLGSHTSTTNWDDGSWDVVLSGTCGNEMKANYKRVNYPIEGESGLTYPKYYDEMQDPPNNLVFSSMAEAEAYECPWVGMNATIDGDKYVFSGDSQSGYEWVENTHLLPNVPFMINYNAKEYDASTKTLPKTEGQLRNSDAVCNYGYHIVDHSADGYITVTGNTRMVISGTPYFNRTNTRTSCTMTIVSKVKTTDAAESYSILTNRGDYGTMNWMWRYPSNAIFLHGSSTYNNPKYFTSTTEQPIIASIRISYDDSLKQLLNDWTNNGSYNGAFQYGSTYNGDNAMFCDYTSISAEFWKGDFYWVYMSFNVLTDEQIQQVIDYNENL